MDWVKQAEQLRAVSTLDRRQAQISVLEDRGLDTAKVTELVAEYENTHDNDTDSESEGTDRGSSRLRSHRSSLDTELLESAMTQRMLLDGLSGVRPPARLSGEHMGDGYSVHVYAGGVGSGKTVTAQSHARRLTGSDTRDIIVFDAVDEWGPVEKATELDIVDRVTKDGGFNADEYDEFLHEPDELLEKLRERDSDEHTVLFITEAHLMLDSRPELLVDILEGNGVDSDSLSVRLVMNDFTELPGFVDVDVYHFHASEEESVKRKLEDIESSNGSVLGGGLSELPAVFPKPVTIGDDEEEIHNPAYMVTVVPATGETSVRANLLDEEEFEELVSA